MTSIPAGARCLDLSEDVFDFQRHGVLAEHAVHKALGESVGHAGVEAALVERGGHFGESGHGLSE